VRGFTKFGTRRREHNRFGHCQYSCHYDSDVWRCFASSADLPRSDRAKNAEILLLRHLWGF
jgi:hypothetical protein